MCKYILLHIVGVSIHAPTRGATCYVLDKVLDKMAFQSTLPRGERPQTEGTNTSPRSFQSTLPRGERPPAVAAGCACVRFQSTLPRGERLRLSVSFAPEREVSIHAPTRGATYYINREKLNRGVSIHAPTRGATAAGFRVNVLFCVSIHAPTRGATTAAAARTMTWAFQSTLPRGERRRRLSPASGCVRFNPRSHAGSDALGAGHDLLCFVSIHAPTRGATGNEYEMVRPTMFQSTLPRGERRGQGYAMGGGKEVSIHAPTRGATRAYMRVSSNSNVSIHAPTRGATLPVCRLLDHLVGFNPRSHAGSDDKPRAPHVVL